MIDTVNGGSRYPSRGVGRNTNVCPGAMPGAAIGKGVSEEEALAGHISRVVVSASTPPPPPPRRRRRRRRRRLYAVNSSLQRRRRRRRRRRVLHVRPLPPAGRPVGLSCSIRTSDDGGVVARSSL